MKMNWKKFKRTIWLGDRCEYCNREVAMHEATDPEGEHSICSLHFHTWSSWPDETHNLTDKRSLRYLQRALRRTWRQYGRPKDWRSQWRELRSIVEYRWPGIEEAK